MKILKPGMKAEIPRQVDSKSVRENSTAPLPPRFYYATCQFGAEKALKAEIQSLYSALKAAFQRPGFITFKEEGSDLEPLWEVDSVFARIWGVAIGPARDIESVEGLFSQVPNGSVVHVFERDLFLPGDEPVVNAAKIDIKKEIDRLGEKYLNRFGLQAIPGAGGVEVYDWIWTDENKYFLGVHRHSKKYLALPGNRPISVTPKDSPSRAYLKIEEALMRFRTPVEVGNEVIEVGCSPGGATSLMLAKGLKVLGVDPKEMSEAVDRHPNFRFVKKPARDCTYSDLKSTNPTWIVLDMNIAPLEALDELGSIIGHLREAHGKTLNVSYGFFTLKLNDWKFAENIPLYLRRIHELGFASTVPLQLATNRQEFFVYAKDFHA